MRTLGNVARHSFYPERTLVRQRDVEPLILKYGSQVGCNGRVGILLSQRPLYAESSPDLRVLEKNKRIGKLVVTSEETAAMTGHDPHNKVYIERGSADIVGLHVKGLNGPRQMYHDLGNAAAYVASHDELRQRENVVGVSYSELVKFAGKLGFRAMPTTQDLEPLVRMQLFAQYKVFRAFNGRQNDRNTFKPAMVYMPTDEFVDRFAPFAGPLREEDITQQGPEATVNIPSQSVVDRAPIRLILPAPEQ